MIKPISGVELTYHSAFIGALFLIASFVIGKVITFTFDISPSANGYGFIGHLVQDLDLKIFYFLGAFAMSFIVSRIFIHKPDKYTWYGDANSGEFWLEFIENKIVVILSLGNGKCYQGVLMDVDVSERVPLEEKLVSVYVLISGFRNPQGIVDWNTKYKMPLMHHFYMGQIVNFSEYKHGAGFKISGKDSVVPRAQRQRPKKG